MEKPKDLVHHTLIHISARPEAWEMWFKAQGVPGLTPKAILTVDSIPAALAAAARGVGVALGMDPLIWEAETAKGLVLAMDVKPVSESAYYVATSKANARRPAIVAFITWLCAEMDRYKRGTRPGSKIF